MSNLTTEIADLHGVAEPEGHPGDARRGRGLAAGVGGPDAVSHLDERSEVEEVAEGPPPDGDAVPDAVE